MAEARTEAQELVEAAAREVARLWQRRSSCAASATSRLGIDALGLGSLTRSR